MTARARQSGTSRLGVCCAGLLGLVTLTGTLAGCAAEKDPDEGTNGVGKLSAAQIERKARKAAKGADAVRLSGSVISKGSSYRLDMRLKNNGGVGEVATKEGPRFELLRVDKDLYLKADADFWIGQDSGGGKQGAADRKAAQKLEGKYVKVPKSDPSHKQLSGFTDMEVLLEGLLALDGKRSSGDRSEVGGVRTVQVTAGEGAGGKLDVSLVGTPYPLRLERGGGAGVVEMAEWDKEFTLRAPKKNQIVDHGEQKSSSGLAG